MSFFETLKSDFDAFESEVVKDLSAIEHSVLFASLGHILATLANALLAIGTPLAVSAANTAISKVTPPVLSAPLETAADNAIGTVSDAATQELDSIISNNSSSSS
jgi:hypothetical protein